MKKLKLKLDGIKEMLTKEQMKKISGGYNCNCTVTLSCDWDEGGFAGTAYGGPADCGDQDEIDNICDVNYSGSYCVSCICPSSC